MEVRECNDDLFGPAVQGCRGNFDFTKSFEHIFLSVIPNALFLVTAAIRIYHLGHQPRIVKGTLFQLLKLGLLLVYFALQLTRAIQFILSHGETVPKLATSAIAMTIVAAVGMMALSFLEHERSFKPSLLLTIYVFLTAIFDAALTRTSWLASVQSWQVTDSHIQLAALVLKLVVLSLESKGKTKFIAGWSPEKHSPEESSGFFSLALMFWLNPLFLRGYRQHCTVENLYAIDQRLGAKLMFSQLAQNLSSANRSGKSIGLARNIAKTLLWPLVCPIAPRLAKIGFTFAQPFFITALISNMQKSNSSSSVNDGYGLIGACVLIYGGIALSNTLYGYYTHRAMYMIRGSLVSAIYQKTLLLGAGEATDTGAVTLMSTDIECIMTGCENIHELWASIVEIALGCWLLHSRLGVAFLSPIIVIIVCLIGMAWVSGTAGKAQATWMDKIQHRVSITSALITNMKPLKISGMVPGLARIVQNSREGEIKAGNLFRLILVISATIAYAPMCLSPVFAFAFTGQNLDVISFFVSLSYLVILSTPLTTVFQNIPVIIAGFTCISRIQQFLEAKIRHDPRIEFCTHGQEKPSPSGSSHPLIRITNGQFGWTKERSVLNNINTVIPDGQFTIVVGPVACGKSTLCKAILGEVPFTEGEVEFGHKIPIIGYCDQSPLLSNHTIRDNIIGTLPFYKEKYQDVIMATCLGPDIDLLPSGHGTVVGNGGSILSGGQKQRVSLARALYHDPALLLLDEVLAGLDQTTEAEVFRRVFGPDGWIRRWKTTAVLFTHSAMHLASADHIIALGKDGSLHEHGKLPGSAECTKVNSSVSGDQKAPLSDDTDPAASEKTLVGPDEGKEKPSNEVHDHARRLGDFRVYKHYFGTIRPATLALFMFSCVLFGFGESFPTMWISFWSSNSYDQSNPFYIGIYGALRVLQLLGFFLAAALALGPMVVDSGSKLHFNALNTVARAPLRFLTTTDNGVITNLFSQDTTIVDTELPKHLFNIAASICAVIGLAVVIAFSSPWLALVYPLLAMVLWLVQRVYLRTSRQLRFLDLEAKSPLYTNFLETARALATIRAFGWATHKLDENYQLVDQSQRPAYLLSMVQWWLQLVMNVMVLALAILVTVLATQLRANPGLAGASLVSLMSLASLVATLVQDYTTFETSIGAVSRLKTFSEEVKPEEQDGEDIRPEEQWPERGRVEFEGLSASYDDLPPESSLSEKPNNLVLKDINLSIPPGQKVAICGRTGSGKSSLLLLLTRLLYPIPGSKITIDEIPVDRIDRSTLRERIIAVPQDAVFLPDGHTIKDNLDPFGLATEDECISVLATVQLDTLATHHKDLLTPLKANQLSGGQAKLFSLGRSVLRQIIKTRTATVDTITKGGLLLLDEISSGVDASTEKLMHAVICKEFSDYTIISVVHSLDLVSQFFDRAIVMDQGVIVESGPPVDLLQVQGWFRELVKEFSQDKE
ncbi:hypothetical protein N7492_003216 [Penicillium capsulatum]|uniref:ABC transporter n=1 Tax=Penicillium capsulatum TaxID=69766 RepID=A0A9W9IMQ9_9EURO|nr:hypothetical protein N7492_003216 [Penicillium capsulatum]KAJ6122197.1 hypothetical protein N7512_004662 [Penicillium capsulatum]